MKNKSSVDIPLADIIAAYRVEFEERIAAYFTEKKSIFDPVFFDAVYYAVFNGGKRVRPILMMMSADFLNLKKTDAFFMLAMAVELIHSYSLVHDDLPCMDNDDYRRGQLTCHKKFGEGTAVLVGDQLLNMAAELALAAAEEGGNCLKAAKYLFDNSGIKGMVGGQYSDIHDDLTDENEILRMYDMKTGGLIRSAFMMPYIMKRRAPIAYSEYESIGKSTALIFQLTDDILDKNKIESNSFCSVFGAEMTAEKVAKYTENVINSLKKYKNSNTFVSFIEYISTRTV